MTPPVSWQACVAIAGLMAAVISLQAVEFRDQPAGAAVPALSYMPSPDALPALALSYDSVAADLYWIRAIQYFGRTRLSNDPAKRYDLLYPLLDRTTSLDPRFGAAYLFGAVFLAEPPPGGPGRADLAIRLLEKGLHAEPGKWEYVQAVGFVHYWWLQDYDEAAAWFARAADVPGAPAWLRPLAASTLTEGGRRESSRLLWREILAAADNEWFRREAARRLRQLDAMDQIDGLQRLADAFAARQGRPPADWAALSGPDSRPGVPVDPSGMPYLLDAGTVRLDPRSPLAPLPSAPLVGR